MTKTKWTAATTLSHVTTWINAVKKAGETVVAKPFPPDPEVERFWALHEQSFLAHEKTLDDEKV